MPVMSAAAGQVDTAAGQVDGSRRRIGSNGFVGIYFSDSQQVCLPQAILSSGLLATQATNGGT